MKKYFLFLFLLPSIAFSQAKKNKTAIKKTESKSIVSNKDIKANPAGFLINGKITGYTDGAKVSLLNANSGAAEATTILKEGKFTLTGKMSFPDFRVITVNDEQRYITLFLDNSMITIKASKDSLESAAVSGSAAHNEFMEYTAATKPYEKMLNQQGNYETAFMAQAAAVLEKFAAFTRWWTACMSPRRRGLDSPWPARSATPTNTIRSNKASITDSWPS